MNTQRRGYMHANDFFYRKNGRNFAHLVLDRNAASATSMCTLNFNTLGQGRKLLLVVITISFGPSHRKIIGVTSFAVSRERKYYIYRGARRVLTSDRYKKGDGDSANIADRKRCREKNLRKKRFSLKVCGVLEITETWARFKNVGGACALTSAELGWKGHCYLVCDEFQCNDTPCATDATNKNKNR